MKLATAQWPAAPRTKDARTAALALAAAFVVMAATQLFSFEKFIPLLETFDLPLWLPGATAAILSVVGSVLALPFLLSMKLSVGMRWLSMVAGWIVVALWLLLALVANLSEVPVDNLGLLGASIRLIPGWWAIFIVANLGILAAWAAWGMWPARHLEPRRKK